MEKVQDSGIFLKNMTKKIVLKDLNNRNYTVEDFDRFRSHINSYHSKGSSIKLKRMDFFLELMIILEQDWILFPKKIINYDFFNL